MKMELTLTKLNSIQTPLEKYRESLPKEAFDNILQAMYDYQYIQNFVRIDRPTISDVPKDSDGKIIVDLTKPHILSNMDYFRKPALKFKQTHKYTEAIPSSNKKSAWALFWKEEARKCLSIAVNPDTGEWIPGDYYFYLNYSPIMRIIKDDKGEAVDRVFDFPDVYDGDYLYFHYLYKARHYVDEFNRGLHGGAIKCRGRGYSFKGGSQLAKRFVLGDSINAQKKVRAFALASEKEYLIKDGILNKFSDIVTHCADHTGWSNSIIKATWNTMEWRSGYVTRDGFERGRKNEVLGVSMKDNSGKARGKRANLILYEEFGKFPNFLDSWSTNRPSTEAGPIAFGQQVAFGTGGEIGVSFAGAEELIYHPDGYRVLGIPNIYDKNTDGSTNCIFFSPEVLNLEGSYDKDGNSDIVKALAHIFYNRWKTKYNSSDPMALLRYIAEHPISIAESIMRTEGNFFPVVDLKEHLSNIRLEGAKYHQRHYVGELVLSGNSVKWQLNADKTPIRSYKKVDDPTGAIEIFEMPKVGADKLPFRNRYIGGIDPVDGDQGTSLCSIFIFDLWTDTIVAEYTGRPKFADDFFEICRRMLMFYNAQGLYENNLKGLFGYFQNHSSTYLLAETPSFLKDMEMTKKGSYGNKAVGFHATIQINDLARRLQKEWMESVAHKDYQEVDDEGNIISTKLNLQLIRSTAYIEEAIAWNALGNFDRVSAMGAVMILREEKKRFLDTYKTQADPVKDTLNSDYFNKNYKSKGSRF